MLPGTAGRRILLHETSSFIVTPRAPHLPETPPEAVRQQTVKQRIHEGVQKRHYQSRREMFRRQKVTHVLVWPPSVHVDQQHDDGDGEPHHQHENYVEEEHPDDLDVLVDPDFLVVRPGAVAVPGGALAGRRELPRPRDEEVGEADLALPP